VEGYTESIASGLLAGRYAAALAQGRTPQAAPRECALGSLTHYITHTEAKTFQPANMTFDLLPALNKDAMEPEMRKRLRDKKERHRIQCDSALAAFDGWMSGAGTHSTSLRAGLGGSHSLAETTAATELPG